MCIGVGSRPTRTRNLPPIQTAHRSHSSKRCRADAQQSSGGAVRRGRALAFAADKGAHSARRRVRDSGKAVPINRRLLGVRLYISSRIARTHQQTCRISLFLRRTEDYLLLEGLDQAGQGRLHMTAIVRARGREALGVFGRAGWFAGRALAAVALRGQQVILDPRNRSREAAS